jgi:hypothetical protein
MLSGLALLAILSASLVRSALPRAGMAMMGLTTAALLLAFGTWAALWATYTYDDSHPEFLVYAQGSAALKETYLQLEQQVFEAPSHNAPVRVGYEMWYPFQWYVRHEERGGTCGSPASKTATKRERPRDAAPPPMNR